MTKKQAQPILDRAAMPLAGIKVEDDYVLSPGDPVGFSGDNLLGMAVKIATVGKFNTGLTHIAICAKHPDTGMLVFYEATSCCDQPCLIAKKIVSGVQCQPIAERVRRYNGSVFVWPLSSPLSTEESKALTINCGEEIGKPYDFSAAVRARVLGLGWLFRLIHPRKENLDSFYCPEFVAEELRKLRQIELANVSNWHPDSLIEEFLRQGACLPPLNVRAVF